MNIHDHSHTRVSHKYTNKSTLVLYVTPVKLPPHSHYYGHMTASPDLYSTNGHLIISPDIYPPNGYLPRLSGDQRTGSNYLPSVSYSLDHLDTLDYQVVYFILF